MPTDAEVIKREFSLAETDVEFEGGDKAVRGPDIQLDIPSSSSSFFGIEVDDNDPQFIATLRLVAYSSIGGSIIMFFAALDSLLIFNLLGAFVFGSLAIIVPVFGYRGARKQKEQSVVAYVYLCTVLATFQVVTAMWRIGLIASTVKGTSVAPPNTTRKSVIVLRVLECILSVLSAMFWGVAGYTGSQLHHAMTDKKKRVIQRQQRDLVRRRPATPPGVLGVDAFRVNNVEDTR